MSRNRLLYKERYLFSIDPLGGKKNICAKDYLWVCFGKVSMEKNYYHFYSDGKLAVELFLSKSDFVAALNRLAVCAVRFPQVVVVAFTLEDTHVHLLLYCREEDGKAFCDMFKKLTMMYVSRTRGGKPADLYILFNDEYIEDADYLKATGAYVLVQPTKDGKGIMPYDYPWSSASLYFRGDKVIPLWCVDRHGDVQKVVRVCDLSYEDRKRYLKTDAVIPGEWAFCNGIILPSNYVDVRRFESIYGTHNSFRFFLSKNSDVEMIRHLTTVKGVSLQDSEMREACRKVCQSRFGVNGVRSLNSAQRLEVARKLRQMYLISHKQLSRIVHVPLEEIKAVF